MFLLRNRGRLCAALAATSFVLLAACGGDTKKTPTATPRPIPAPVEYRPDPQGVELGDPKFDALPGTKADYGHLGGTVYRIEIPDNWNGRLVLYMHGFQGLDPTARVETPGIRDYLIRNGIAWGASSFSSTALIPGRAADETAALWDLFVSKYGEPKRTYIMGHSMGGGATHIAAERYGNRYDGALGMCGFAGQTAESTNIDDFFFAGAYAAGVTQAQFDASNDIPNLITTRIVPALNDPAARKTFEDILLGITGGPRPFDRLGIHLEEQTNWSRAGILVPFHIVGNSDRTYEFYPGTSVPIDDFNRNVIRFKADPERAKAFMEGNEVTGDLQMPMITLHTTGDWQVPIDQEQILRRKVDAAGKGDQLVQRIVQDAGHCHFTEGEWERSFEDLVNWVEKGIKPDGDNVLVDDLTHAGERFTLAPRLGTAAADGVPGAAERVTVRGTVTIDGGLAGPDTFFWMDVSKDGLRQACSFSGDPFVAGRYQLTVAGEGELHGCGAPGTKLRLVVFVRDKQLVSQPLDWPTGRETTLDAAFETAAATDAIVFTPVFGGVIGSDGKHMPPGTRVEAYAGETLCAAGSVSPVVMPFNDPDSYSLLVPGPAAIAACTKDASLTFRVDGKSVPETSTNDFDQNGHALDLVVPAGN
jgi:pimeloyl-ACP methyl ester carboxylesterase